MPLPFWNCPKPAAQYKAEHRITEFDFNSRNPAYLTSHTTEYVTGIVSTVADCQTPIGVDPAGNLLPPSAPGMVYYPAGLFKAILEEEPENFEMFATQQTTPPFRQDVIMKVNSKSGKASFYDMSYGQGF